MIAVLVTAALAVLCITGLAVFFRLTRDDSAHAPRPRGLHARPAGESAGSTRAFPRLSVLPARRADPFADVWAPPQLHHDLPAERQWPFPSDPAVPASPEPSPTQGGPGAGTAANAPGPARPPRPGSDGSALQPAAPVAAAGPGDLPQATVVSHPRLGVWNGHTDIRPPDPDALTMAAAQYHAACDAAYLKAAAEGTGSLGISDADWPHLAEDQFGHWHWASDDTLTSMPAVAARPRDKRTGRFLPRAS